jgi:hypothetical protein
MPVSQPCCGPFCFCLFCSVFLSHKVFLVSQYNSIKALVRRYLGSVKVLSRVSLDRAYKALFVKALF